MIVGGLLGHFLCTGLGVLGGRMIATKISVRTGKLIFRFIALEFTVLVAVLISETTTAVCRAFPVLHDLSSCIFYHNNIRLPIKSISD